MAAGPIAERNQDATIYVGGLDDKVSESLMWELFVQAGPVVNVHMPKDRVTQMHQGYGFVEFLGEDDADYAIKIMNMIKLYGKPIRVNKASAHQKNLDVGANIFIGNLDAEVDEKLLYDTFSAFGVILQTPKIMRDPETGNSKGFAFINYASFDASDAAIDAMNGQYLCNRPVSVSYAYKKDAKGERHGSAAERLLAAQNPLSQADRPHQLFADAPPPAPLPPPPPPVNLGMGPPVGFNPPPPPPVPPPNSMPPPPMSMPPPPLPPQQPPPMQMPPPLPPNSMMSQMNQQNVPPPLPPMPPGSGAGMPPGPPLPPGARPPHMGGMPPGGPPPPPGMGPMPPQMMNQQGPPPPPRLMPPPWHNPNQPPLPPPLPQQQSQQQQPPLPPPQGSQQQYMPPPPHMQGPFPPPPPMQGPPGQRPPPNWRPPMPPPPGVRGGPPPPPGSIPPPPGQFGGPPRPPFAPPPPPMSDFNEDNCYNENY